MAVGHARYSVPEQLGRDVDGHVCSFEGGGDQVPERVETSAVAGDAAALTITSKPFAESMAIGAINLVQCWKEAGGEGTLVPREAQENSL